tara:strand:- start:8061 stop:8768 length:708 start_codon:yes stop_codon:yes gene_type:complete
MTNLITLAGEGSRFAIEGFNLPKPLIKVNGEPMIFKAVDCLPKAEKYVFVCRNEHIEKYSLDSILKNRYPNVEIITINETTEGQACTAEIGIKKSSIKSDDEILISSCDYGLEYSNFKNDKDIIVWTTTNNKAFSDNPSAYSWLEIDDELIKKVHVKSDVFSDPFNRHAIVGTFYFKKAQYFLDGFYNSSKSKNEYYIDGIFNNISKDINLFCVDQYHCWGTPKDLENYEDKILG